MKSRTIHAAMLLAALIAVLLAGWFVSGWADVRARAEAMRDAPAVAASQRAVELAHELRGELAKLTGREVDRPYFHYQNVFHDPRSSVAYGVTPSPLADGPDDPFVLGYFRIDDKGRVTTPTINDEVPALSEQKHLAGNTQFRNEVVRTLAGPLAPRGPGPLVASAPKKPKRPTIQAPEAQVFQIDPSSYAQNNMSNEIYQQQRAIPPQPQVSSRQQAAPPPVSVQAAGNYDGNFDPDKPPVAVYVSGFEWKTLPFGGGPTLVAVRHVQMPDGALSQGFVVDRATLTSWLATHAGESVAQLVTGEGGEAAEIAPDWHLDVTPNPRAVTAAAVDAGHIATMFLIRFAIGGVIAVIAAMLVVFLMARAEALARERSNFAAAAAHELRTPLAGLQLYGDMLADGLGDPNKMRDYAKRMSEEASRLGRVVSNVLGFSQLERGNLSVDAKPGPLGEVLGELVERARPALERAGAKLDVDVPAELSARYDRDALTRIVGNLLDNAEKYARGASDRTIGLVAAASGDAIEIAVTDRGPGVDAKARPKLFQPFKRGVTADGPAGLGLGLALSQSLARAMGGDLAYRPGEAGGAEFVLRLGPA